MSVDTVEQRAFSLLDQAIGNAEQEIFRRLRGADNETRLNSLDTLDALGEVSKQLRILQETCEDE